MVITFKDRILYPHGAHTDRYISIENDFFCLISEKKIVNLVILILLTIGSVYTIYLTDWRGGEAINSFIILFRVTYHLSFSFILLFYIFFLTNSSSSKKENKTKHIMERSLTIFIFIRIQ